MKNKEKLLRCLPLVAMALIIVLFGATLREITIEDILNFSPDNLLLAALVVLGLYALKSVSVVFPLMVLYISVGAMFPLLPAMFINCAGLLVCITIPFYIGRFSGSEVVGKLITKYPKAQKISDYSSENSVFFSYLLRIINLLPGDVVSMVLGASGMNFFAYAIGSMLGLLPVMIPAVIVGQNLDEPLSAGFWIPFVVIAVLSLASSLVYNRFRKRK